MNEKEITATFKVAIPTINHHIKLAESNIGEGRPTLEHVHFEIENDRVHIVSTDGRALLHTEVQSDGGIANEPIAFNVHFMPRITAYHAHMTADRPPPLFVAKDGLISTGDIVARIVVDIRFPNWREVLPGRERLKRETAWRPLDPKYYALAQKFAGGDGYAFAHRVKGQTNGLAVFLNVLADEDELNTAVVMPLRER